MKKKRTDEEYKSLILIWKYIRQLTYDYIETMNKTSLKRRLPRPALNTIGKHILELGDVTKAYAIGIKNRNICFDDVRWTFPRKEILSKRIQIAHLRKSDSILDSSLKSIKNKNKKHILLGGEMLSVKEIIIWLSMHEILHHGQLIAFGYLSGDKFPKTWIDQWALPNKGK